MKVAVIPARGGSKRIPRKNIREFRGKPIIAYSIEAAIATGLFDSVTVSTDDEEIADVSRSFGADVPFMRPAELADDLTGTDAVVRHALAWHVANGSRLTHACCIYATAPFVQPRILVEGYERLVASGKSFAFSVTSFPFPIQRALRITADGGVEPILPQHVQTRSQDLEPAYHDAGQFYWGLSRAFLDGDITFSPASEAIVLPRWLVQDIDTEEDWRRAELLHEVITMAEARR